MSKFWETGWDPLQAIRLAEKNIHQLAQAYNNQQAELDQVRALATHQQEVLQQIVQQNNKLNQILSAQRAEINQLKQMIMENNRGTTPT